MKLFGKLFTHQKFIAFATFIFALLSFLTITPQRADALIDAGKCNFTLSKTTLATNDTLAVYLSVEGKQSSGNANRNNEPAYSAYITNNQNSRISVSANIQRSAPGTSTQLTFNLNLSTANPKFVSGAATVGITNPSSGGYRCYYNNTDQQTITVQVNDPNNQQKSLSITTDPSNPITQTFTTMTSMVISGLDSNKTYQLTMAGPNGSHGISHPAPNNNDWPTNGGSIITISGMCENGNSQRNDCSAAFKDGAYNINVINNGQNIGFGTFNVNTGNQGGAGGPGTNPCISGTCQTALGPISTNPTDFIGKVLAIAIGLGGGIALIIMVIGSIKVLTSSGDQQKLNGGKDMIVAAVSGLLFLIFSVLILRFIGTQFLGITL